MDLRSFCRADSIATIKCPQDFNLNGVLLDRKSLNRLCGYGDTAPSRYLDDSGADVQSEIIK